MAVDEPNSSGSIEPSLASNAEERIARLENQVKNLSSRLDAAIMRLEQLTSRLSNSAATVTSTPEAPASPSMLEVIKLIHSGNAEEAQRKLQSMPPAELKSQPAVVALAAAAVCIQRGDLDAGLKALERAKSFTSDPRLSKVIDLLGSRAAGAEA